MGKFKLQEMQEHIDNNNYDFFIQNEYAIDWFLISYSLTFKEEFMEKFLNKISIKMICRYQELSHEFMRRHKDKLDWDSISGYQRTLTLDFIKEMYEYMKLKYLLNNGNITLPEEFIEEHLEDINKNSLIEAYHYNKFSEDFIRRNNFNPIKVVGKQRNISLDYIWDNRDKIDWDYVVKYNKILTFEFLDKAIEYGYIYDENSEKYIEYHNLNKKIEEDYKDNWRYDNSEERKKEQNKKLKKIEKEYQYKNKIPMWFLLTEISTSHPIKFEEWFVEKYIEKYSRFDDYFDYLNIIVEENNFSEELLLKYFDKCQFYRECFNNRYRRNNEYKIAEISRQLYGCVIWNSYRSIYSFNDKKAKEKLKNGYKIIFKE